MRKILILSGLTGTLAFFAGKYVYEEQIKRQNKQAQFAKLNRNSHSPHTVQQPFRLLTYPHYNIVYSTYHKSPLAVHEYLTKSLMSGDAPRAKFFFPDDNILEKHFQVDQSYYKDTDSYKILKVNRGHMAAAGNYSGSQYQKFHTFTFTNIIPQNYYNNGGIWNTFERYTRKLAQNPICQSVQVISGPIYIKNTPYNTSEKSQKYISKLSVLKENGIPIPQMLYKIIKCNSKDKAYYSAFQFSNSQTYDNERTLEDFKVQIGKIEQETGLHFNINGGSLSQIDPVGLKTKKKQFDYQFFFKLMEKSNSISQMNEGFRRAKQQKIQINFSDLTDKIRLLLKGQIQTLKSQNLLECQRLLKLLRLNKKIYYLYHLQKTTDLRVSNLQQGYKQCLLKKQDNAQQQKQYQQITKEVGNDILRFINK